MRYEGRIFRPPSEADSILLQVTIGCSHNRCTFCGMYRGERFRIRDEAMILEDLAYASRHCRRQERVFLCDGDALVVPQPLLLRVLRAVREQLPWVTRVASYASAGTVALKSDRELRDLREEGLKLIHLGLESGDDVTLEEVQKRGDSASQIEQGLRVRAAGMKLFVTVVLGLAGRARSGAHARATGLALTRLAPSYVGALSLMLVPGTPLYSAWEGGTFALPEPRELLEELRELLIHTDLHGMFYANHASNPLPIRARLPRDKAGTLALIERALAGDVPLRPEWLRGL